HFSLSRLILTGTLKETSHIQTNMNYGKALRISRAIVGLQQRELAEKAGLNASHVSLIEKGSRNPSVGAITKLCDAMKIPESLFTMLAAEADDLRGIKEAEFEA